LIVILIVVEGALSMKDPIEVLRMKEQEILRVKREIEALRITAELLGEEPPSAGDGTRRRNPAGLVEDAKNKVKDKIEGFKERHSA
jgi:hypothetical protein